MAVVTVIVHAETEHVVILYCQSNIIGQCIVDTLGTDTAVMQFSEEHC